MSGGACVHCGCSDIDKDPTRGVAVCTNCGSVLEDQLIVSEVQFEENNRGGTSVLGTYVPKEGKTISFGANYRHGMGKESRLITLANGKKRISHLGSQLQLNQHCIDTAYNFFKIAVSRQLTRGRKTMHVIAACLYLVCRTEGTPHMLLDFADILQANVYALGRTYLQLSREMHINIPALDPCLYIQRFAHRLEFADKTHDVGKTALRLVSRMKRDWMVQGRRPSGLCGAALLVAARIHNFSRSIREIIRVVNISEGTIRKRLAEFEATSSSGLTVEEFQNIDLEEEADPPCFTESRKKAKLQQLEDAGELPKLTEEVAQLQDEIDMALQEIMLKKHRRFGKTNLPNLGGDAESTTSDIGDDINRLLDQDSLRDVFFKAGVGKSDDEDDDAPPKKCLDDSGAEKDPDVARLEDDELNLLLRPTPGGITGPRPTAASLGIMDSIEQCMTDKSDKKDGEEKEAEEKEEESGELDLEGIDDDEIDKFILSEGEVKIKALAWIKANADYLKEQKEKQEKEAKEREENKNKPEKKKRRVSKKPKEARTAGEALERVIQEKKISTKINYDVLKGLTTTTTSSSLGDSAAGNPLGDRPIQATEVMLRSPKGGRFRRSSMSLEDDGPSASKRPRLSGVKHSVKAELEEASKPPVEVICEEGPVEYAEQKDEEEEVDSEFEDDDELNAPQLQMFQSNFRAEEEYGHEYDYDDD